MISPFVDAGSHLSSSHLKLSPPHHVADAGQGHFGVQTNGYAMPAHVTGYGSRDLGLLRAADGAYPPSSAYGQVSFPGLHESAQHSAAAAAGQLRLGADSGFYSRHDHLNAMAATHASDFHAMHNFNAAHPLSTTGALNHMALSGHHGASPFFRYMRPPVKQEHTCLWIDPLQHEPRKPCNKTFYSMHDVVTHLTIEHVGGPEQTDHACYWKDCERELKPFKAKYKLVNHIRLVDFLNYPQYLLLFSMVHLFSERVLACSPRPPFTLDVIISEG